ncbi:peptidylprolyl isomerase [Candidatus Micrarchaeota archaeon]|nr:peptidylprolyl isomerase [Candidatus Micrarchaeota archaeon]
MIKKNDLVKIEYTGYDKDGNVFDSTGGEVAKSLRKKEGPVLVALGQKQILKGLEEQILKMKEGEEKEFAIPFSEAFGKRKKEFLRIMKESDFADNKLNPYPGLTVDVDFGMGKMIGRIKSVTSGRVLVDFNHPLAGQDLKYKLKILKVYSTPEEKVSALAEESELKPSFQIKNGEAEIEVKKPEKMDENTFKILKANLFDTIKRVAPEIKNVKEKE